MREGGRTGWMVGRFGWTSGEVSIQAASCREVEPTGRKMSVDDELTSPVAFSSRRMSRRSAEASACVHSTVPPPRASH